MDDTTQTIISLLVLQRLPDVAANTLNKLFVHFGQVEKILKASSEELSHYLGHAALREFDDFRIKGGDSVAGEIALKDREFMTKKDISILTADSEFYPPMLNQIHAHPPILMAQGNLEALLQEKIAIVGSRKASPTGCEIAQQFSKELSEYGLTVVSGLAIGVDASAHLGALSVDPDLNRHATIAVIATGLDLCYPHRHEFLRNAILKRGAIISEFPLGTAPRKENFPRRNRIISGISKGVVVIEAEDKSGSLITARYALEQNREVFAVPGSIKNPASRGCHQLIREGAKLTESIDDILSELRHPFGKILLPLMEKQGDETAPLSNDEKRLTACMDENPVSADQLARRSLIPIEEVVSILTELELKSVVILTSGGYQLLSGIPNSR